MEFLRPDLIEYLNEVNELRNKTLSLYFAFVLCLILDPPLSLCFTDRLGISNPNLFVPLFFVVFFFNHSATLRGFVDLWE